MLLFFIPMSGGKTGHLGHLPPQIHKKSHTNVNPCPVFLFEGLFEITCDFSFFWFLGNNKQHRPVCAKTISSWVRKVLSVAKAHMSPGSLGGLQLLQP